MEIVTELREIPNLSLALGFFDGVHIGHQAVISSAIKYAKINNSKSAVITFKEHPAKFLNKKNIKYIYSKEKKYDLFSNLGVDYVIELDFESVCMMTPIEYLENILVHYFSPCAISTGYNHTFGFNKSGDTEFLEKYSKYFGYKYCAIPYEVVLDDVVSSTMIRHSIEDGAFHLVNKMLGRVYELKGKVIEGKKLGRTIGFPTINIEYPQRLVHPHIGVYEVNVILENGEKYKGVANFGLRPTVSNEKKTLLEVHIIDFEGNLYNKDVRIQFLKLLRYEKKFDSLKDLKSQIAIDIEEIIH